MKEDNAILLSIVIPLFNEEESLTELHEKIVRHIQERNLGSYEIIFVNDGSTDNSLSILLELHKKDVNIRIIDFYRNYGKAAALSTGFQKSRGEYVITMDADLQDDPNEISSFIDLANDKNWDMISGWKKVRHDPLEKRLPSRFFNYITSLVGGIRLHDFNCGFKFYRKKVVKSLHFYGEMHRFLPMLAHWQGFQVGEKVVEHHPRKFGSSKYGIARYMHGFLDLLTLMFLHRYSTRPMHIFGGLGVILMLLGLGVDLYFFLVWAIERALHIRPMMLVGILLNIISLQFISMGFLGEMLTYSNYKKTHYLHEELTAVDSLETK